MSARPIFFDTETTGVRTDSDRIVEIAAYDPEKEAVFHQLIQPQMPIPPDAMKVHGITNEMVADAPLFVQIIEKWNAFCLGDIVLIAHNGDAFDLPFIRREYVRCGFPVPDWKTFDTLKWARRYRPDLPSHSLQYLREIYAIPANQAHRALDDVKVLHQIYLRLIDDLSIEDICSLMAQPRKISKMPFGKYQGKPLKDIPNDYIQWIKEKGILDKAENQLLKESLAELGKIVTSVGSYEKI